MDKAVNSPATTSPMRKPAFPYRLGLDLGTNSIGWAVLRLNADSQPCAVVSAGSRIFSDGRHPKSKQSLAVERRLARQMRRRRDRLLRRKRRLIHTLVEYGLWPSDRVQQRSLVHMDPYEIRARGLDKPLTGPELGRALFHICVRRGFKSNRKTDKGDSDSGVMKASINSTRKAIFDNNSRTVGEWLSKRHSQRISVRARRRGVKASEVTYDLYVDRSMAEHEFQLLWETQSKFDALLFNAAAKEAIHSAIFYQRPLRPVEAGRCTLLPEEKRAPAASVWFQNARILQDLNHIRLRADGGVGEPRALTLQERDCLFDLLQTKDLKWEQVCKVLGLPADTVFNLASDRRSLLRGNSTAKALSKKAVLGATWKSLAPNIRDELVDKLLEEESEAVLSEWLQRLNLFDSEQIEALLSASLEQGYGNLSLKALKAITPHLSSAVITYDKAVDLAGLGSHSLSRSLGDEFEPLQQLPYYGRVLTRHVAFGTGKDSDSEERRYGKIANPTVHIALNELRKVANELILRYGHPQQVVVELARDLGHSAEMASEENARQAKNQKRNDSIRAIVSELTGVDPANVLRADIERYKLWEDLNPKDAAARCCPYTGTPISLSMLFGSEVEVEHILPFSRTLDDSLNNKTLSMRKANRLKGNQSPFEAFGASPTGYKWDEILARARYMDPAKARRFAPDAMAKADSEGGFLARALNDTRYLSRLAREYLSFICHEHSVWVTPGRLTAQLRRLWGLNKVLSPADIKNRHDHRHHAIDAIVVAATDRRTLQTFSRMAEQARQRMVGRLVEDLPAPFSNFWEHVKRAIDRVVVSHRPDHGHQGAMHNDTAYGLFDEGVASQFVSLSKFDSVAAIKEADFVDSDLQGRLLAAISDKDKDGVLAELQSVRWPKRVRVKQNLKLITMNSSQSSDRHGVDPVTGTTRPYKGYKGDSNYCIEISLGPNGKWVGDVISTFEAHQIVRHGGVAALRNPRVGRSGHPLVMRLMRGDYVRLVHNGERGLYTVRVVKGSGQILFALHLEGNVDARDRDAQDPFKYVTKVASSLHSSDACAMTVSPAGRVRKK